MGVALKAFDRLSHPWLSTGLYLAMGWVVLIAVGPLVERVPAPGIALLVAGGSSPRRVPSTAISLTSTPDATPNAGRLRTWRDRAFAATARNAAGAPDFFNIPANRVVELGTRIRNLISRRA